MAMFTHDDRQALTDALTRLLTDHAGEGEVRRVMETPEGYDPQLWRRLSEMGVVGLIIDESYGGGGAGPVELERVMEVAGSALLCGPLISSGVLAAGLVQALGDEGQKNRWLPKLADGTCIATAALTGPGGGWTQTDVAVTAQAAGPSWRLSGQAAFVTHGQIAELILVVARTNTGIGVFAVEAGAEGLTSAALPTFDHTLRLADLTLADVMAERLGGDAWPAVERVLDLARVALAGEQAGATRHCLTQTVDYAKTRIQFGRPIGGFQAIKHMAADLLLESESAISAARHAAQALADGGPEAPAAVSLAAFACADAFVTTAATSIQMHGGIAFTWAHPAHLYLRRARADAQLLGTPAFYRERYVQQLAG